MNDQTMPVLFIGHGSPMNALADNDFTRTLVSLGKRLPEPKALLCVSAHWMSEGSWITGMQRPKTIHDFYGFPEELFKIQYEAQASPDIAAMIQSVTKDPEIHLDKEMWGYDHGAWSVLKHMYPSPKFPVLQLSIYMKQPPEYHFKLGTELRKLRDMGVLIIGSGNIVHNLRLLDWDENARPHEWAREFDEWSKEKILARDWKALIHDVRQSEAGRLAVPTYDHYYPLLYVLGAAREDDELAFEYEGIQNASISMRCLSFSPGTRRVS